VDGGGAVTRVEGVDRVKGDGRALPQPQQAWPRIPSSLSACQKVAISIVYVYSLVCDLAHGRKSLDTIHYTFGLRRTGLGTGVPIDGTIISFDGVQKLTKRNCDS
jgi:hypothetical protein